MPQLFIQYFWKHHTGKPTLALEKDISDSITKLTKEESKHNSDKDTQYSEDITLRHAKYDGKPINLFTNHVFFNDYQALVNEIEVVNGRAKQSFGQFDQLVEQIRI